MTTDQIILRKRAAIRRYAAEGKDRLAVAVQDEVALLLYQANEIERLKQELQVWQRRYHEVAELYKGAATESAIYLEIMLNRANQ
jgi:hypothetical protein